MVVTFATGARAARSGWTFRWDSVPSWCKKGCEVDAPDLGLDGASGERDSAAIRVQTDAALPVERDAKPLRFAAFERYTPEARHRLARSADQQMTVVSRPL